MSERFQHGHLKLVVGGGRAGPMRIWDSVTETWYEIEGMPEPRSRAVKLNIDPDARPDVIGDINRAPFKSQAFVEVLFEKVPWDTFTGENLGAINESARILKPGGRLVIETGSGVRSCLAAFRERMDELGFRNIRVTQKRRGGVRIAGRLGGA
jgi:hypothetical protein